MMHHPVTSLALAGLLLVPANGRAQEPTAEIIEEPTADSPEEPTTDSPEKPTAEIIEEPTADSPEEPTEVADEPAPVPAQTPRAMYDAASRALESGDRDRARTLLRSMRQRYAAAWETAALARRLGQAKPAEKNRLEWGQERFRGKAERYSRATGERLTLSGWEVADFSVTNLLYGACVGAAYAFGLDTDDKNAFGAMLLGAAAYGALGATFLSMGNPDRGDLPLALGITSYVPLTALMIGMAADVNDEEDMALAMALSGSLALPVAGIMGVYTDLDPGDAQLTRDAGFWGFVLALTSTAAFGCSDRYYGCDDSTYGATGLLGLYAGLGAGALLAAHTEVSLERVRATTLYGYAGAMLGMGLGLGIADNDDGIFGGITVGSAVGLLLGSVLTRSLDDWPDNAIAVGHSFVVMPVVDHKGDTLPALGVELFGP